MIVKIIFLIIFIAASVYLQTLNYLAAKTKTQILIGLGLWILGLYIGLLIRAF